MRGWSGAGCMFPRVSKALEVIVCSPEDGLFQSRDQNAQANSAFWLRSIVADTQDPPSICTPTRAMGPPHAAPTIRFWPSFRVTLAGADFNNALPTDVSAHTGS